MQEFTQQGGVRPFGVSLMIAGIDDNGPHLFQVDPSGAYFGSCSFSEVLMLGGFGLVSPKDSSIIDSAELVPVRTISTIL